MKLVVMYLPTRDGGYVLQCRKTLPEYFAADVVASAGATIAATDAPAPHRSELRLGKFLREGHLVSYSKNKQTPILRRRRQLRTAVTLQIIMSTCNRGIRHANAIS